MSAFKTIGQQLGAELLTGLGEFKAGHGAIVKDWHPSAEEALRQFCEMSGQQALLKALGNWMKWRNPITAAHLCDIHGLCGPADNDAVEEALSAWINAPDARTSERLVVTITRSPLVF